MYIIFDEYVAPPMLKSVQKQMAERRQKDKAESAKTESSTLLNGKQEERKAMTTATTAKSTPRQQR